MSQYEGISALEPQTLVLAEAGTDDLIYVYIDGPTPLPPRRVGYFWHNITSQDRGIGITVKQGGVPITGIAFPKAASYSTTNNKNTVIVQWNEPGLHWYIFF